jgi:prophage tail gpP-like protein
LSRIYKAIGGESWSAVARRTTGNDVDADAIRRANPGMRAPLEAGATVQIPIGEEFDPSPSDDELQIVIDGQEIGTFDHFEIQIAIDAISKCSFVLPNEPETRKILRPLGAQRIVINAFGRRIFTGRCRTPIPNNTPESKTIDVECYSDPAVLERGTPQISNMPGEWKDAQLEQIADDLCRVHGISLRFESPTVARFKRVDIQPGQPVLGFLSDLATQRGLLIASDEFGGLVFRGGESVGTPVSFIEERPGIDVHIGINEDRYFSSVTGSVPSKSRRGRKGASFTVDNPYRTDVICDHHFDCQDIDEGELENAVKAAAGRMFAELVMASAEVATWKNDQGEIYWPGQTVWVKDEAEYVPDFVEFLVSMVTLKRSSEGMSAFLNLTLPGVYNGEIPEVLPWQQ